MPRIPEDLLNRIKEEIRVEDLARRRGIELKKVGENVVGFCPFHLDRHTPNLVITPAKNVWHCFVCQKGGSPIDWTMKEKGVSVRHALEILVAEFFPLELASALTIPRRTTVPQVSSPLDQTADDRQLALDVVGYYHGAAKASPELQAFLEKRGMASEETFEHFQLGYANRTLGYRLPAMVTKAGGAIRARLQKLGFLRESGHEHFSGSLVIPIFGESGDVVGCYGRKIRSDLRPGTPDHLYLPGPHRGVFNIRALEASREIILCEALIDAIKAWHEGFRNVTSAYGTEGFTGEMLEAFTRHGVEKVLIAFDRDQAGDRGAEKVAAKLMAKGIDCYRVLFPHKMDLNEYALKLTPAARSLDVLFRSAVWMGNGSKPGHAAVALAAGVPPPAPPRSPGGWSLLAPRTPPSTPHDVPVVMPAPLAAEDPEPAAKEENRPDAALEPSPVLRSPQDEAHADAPVSVTEPASEAPQAPGASDPAPAATNPIKSSEDEAHFLFGDRRYRVRGLKRNLSFGLMKVNLFASRDGLFDETGALRSESAPIAGFHVDSLDLYSARSRQLFEKQAGLEMGVEDHAVKRDLGQVLRMLEALQQEAIEKALKPKVKTVTLTGKETAEAMALLKDPKLLQRILADFSRCGLVGEETNKLVAYLAATSRKLDRPLAVIIQSSSAAGKSRLMEAVLDFMPEEEREKYSALTANSLFYFSEDKSLRHKILAIAEEHGAERATYALKLLQSEGELTIASTGKDPQTGRLVTQEYRVEGPVMIFLTTTAVEIDEELLNRCLVLSVDEDREQTKRIHELQREAETIEGLLRAHERERLLALHQNAQRLLRPLAVVNPFARELTFVDDRTRTRRDHVKYLTLIRTIALLFQYQRPVKRVKRNGSGADEIEYVEVTREDIAVANRLCAEVLGRSLDELPARTRKLLMLLDGWVSEACFRGEVHRCDFLFSARGAREKTGFTHDQLRVHLGRLIALEYVLVHRGGRGQCFVYELLYDGKGKDGKPFVVGLIDIDSLARTGALDLSTTTTAGGEKPGCGGPMGWGGGADGVWVVGGGNGTKPVWKKGFLTLAAESPESSPLGGHAKESSYPNEGPAAKEKARWPRAPRINLIRRPAITLERNLVEV
jgi:DNA primase catalytic core